MAKLSTNWVDIFGINSLIETQISIRELFYIYFKAKSFFGPSGAREGVIIKWPLNWQFHDVVIIRLKSQMAIRKKFLTVAVIENVRTFVIFYVLTVKSLIYKFSGKYWKLTTKEPIKHPHNLKISRHRKINGLRLYFFNNVHKSNVR